MALARHLSAHGNNTTGWGNARYDDRLNQSAREGDPKKRFGILHEAETILMDEMPVLPVYWYTHSYLVHSMVKNFNPSVLEHRCYKAIDLQP